MTLKLGFGLLRPSVFVFGLLLLTYGITVGLMLALDDTSKALDPSLLAAMAVVSGFPNLNLLAWVNILLLKWRDYVSLRAIVLAYVMSIPAGLWAMSAVQAPMLKTQRERLSSMSREWALAIRQLLNEPLYRVLFLFHYASLPVAARSFWVSMLCNLPATLGHLAVMRVMYDNFMDKSETTPSALSYCIIIPAAVAGYASLLLIETRARAIVRSGCLIEDLEAQSGSDDETQFGCDDEAQSGSDDEAQFGSDDKEPVTEKSIPETRVESC